MGVRPVDREIVKNVCRDFDITGGLGTIAKETEVSSANDQPAAPVSPGESTPPVPIRPQTERERRLFSMFGVRRTRSGA
jgi:hypothetical protein